MHDIFGCKMTESTLDKLIEVFVPKNDFHFFSDDEILNACLCQGITVYTREEFPSSFPFFALEYGSLYQIWKMKRPKDSYVLVTSPTELDSLPQDIQRRLFRTQIQYGRGHIYETDWLNQFKIQMSNTITVNGKSYYFLTWEDWSVFSSGTRKEWLLQWLREWRKEEEYTEMIQFTHNHEGVPYDLIREYAGTFADKSTANCFAAAIAMVVGTRNQPQSRVLISQWLHQGPFLRLLYGQGYSKHTECRDIADLVFQPSDVLVWYTGDGIADHAGYAVSDGLIFQKQAQGWDNPWQILKVNDVWYNEYLKLGGHIEIYRSIV